jgi:hypothetical protein
MLELLFFGAVAAIYAFTIVFYAFLTYLIIVEWFREIASLANRPNNIAATIKTELENGQAVVVQGVFNQNTGESVKARTIKYNQIDNELRTIHSRTKVAIYQ